MLTIIISNNHTSEDLYHTLRSVKRAAKNFKPQLLVLNTSEIEFDKNEFSALNIAYTENVLSHDMNAFGKALAAAEEKYVMFADSGDIFAARFFERLGAVIDGCEENIITVEYASIGYDSVAKEGFKGEKSITREEVNLRFKPYLAPACTTGVLFKTAALKKEGIKPVLKNDGLKYAMASLLGKTDSYLKLSGLLLKSAYPTESDSVNFPLMHKPEWYFDDIEGYVLSLLRNIRDGGRAKPFAQYLALGEMKWRFLYNRNANDKHLVEKEPERFFALCREVFSEIDNNVLFNLDNASDYKMTLGMYLAMLHAKYGETLECSYSFDSSSIQRVFKDLVIAKSRQLKVILEVLECEDGKLTVEASVDDFLDMTKCRLECFFNGEPLEFTETYRYAHTKYFGISTNKRYTFRFELDKDKMSSGGSVTFFISCGSYRVQIPITTRRYTTRFSTAVNYSYWMTGFENKAVYSGENDSALVIANLSGSAKLTRELKLMLYMLIGREKAPGMFFTRLCYHLTKPYYKNKRIWLTYDKLYKGGDCGEYFYKYMMSQKDGITPVYVINRDAEDLRRLRREGYKPTRFGTLKNRLQYLNAEVVFATHGGVHTFNGISNSRAKFICDLIHADVTCIQHGLSVQQLAQELNKVYNNTKRYYCASKYEIQNLEKPIYGYEDKSALRLTGIPRYDGLVSNDQKQILITPTWRAYISMPPVMGQSRPYYPEFKNTNYYKFYYNLLTDEKLIETARRTGYKLIYLLHPIISSQIVDYPEIDGVEIIPATEVNYEKILTESSLMLTDYSGVQFDFAYMRKPVVYYHPPELPPHYKEGGFFYDTMGFGEICTEHKGMVDCLCEYMENGCEMKPFYKDRADDFFAFSDLDSCKRIYDDMTNYIAEKKKKAAV